MFPSGFSENWELPADYWAFFQQMHAAQQEDKLTIKVCGTVRCNSCGKFMSLFNAHLTVSQLGTVHMKKKCVEKAVKKLRGLKPDWNWGK